MTTDLSFSQQVFIFRKDVLFKTIFNSFLRFIIQGMIRVYMGKQRLQLNLCSKITIAPISGPLNPTGNQIKLSANRGIPWQHNTIPLHYDTGTPCYSGGHKR